jgi:hypothetical protein
MLKSQNQKKIVNQSKPTKVAIYPEYRAIVERVFKRIDFFNRDCIDETNINKWINQKVLYFFGSIFHSIKTKKLTLTKQQFLMYADKIFEKSNITDIHDFMTSALAEIDMLDPTVGYDNKISISRGVAAVTQAAAMAPSVSNRYKSQLRLGDLDYNVDFGSKQTITPLFSDTSLRPKLIDPNRPVAKLHSNSIKPPSN